MARDMEQHAQLLEDRRLRIVSDDAEQTGDACWWMPRQLSRPMMAVGLAIVGLAAGAAIHAGFDARTSAGTTPSSSQSPALRASFASLHEEDPEADPKADPEADPEADPNERLEDLEADPEAAGSHQDEAREKSEEPGEEREAAKEADEKNEELMGSEEVRDKPKPEHAATEGAVPSSELTVFDANSAELENRQEDRSCSTPGASCLTSKCCKDPGMQCYGKDPSWAECLEFCVPGPRVTDQSSPMPWSCQAFGNRTSGPPKACSADRENCLQTQCCKSGGHTCYRKNATFGMCRPYCSPGPDITSDDPDPWQCGALGPATPGAAPWVRERCAWGTEDCRIKACCGEVGHQCYKQNDGYGRCRSDCAPGMKLFPEDQPWSCIPVGMRTPDYAETSAPVGGLVASWVPRVCAGRSQNCLQSQCCTEVGAQCFRKNAFWGACMAGCDPMMESTNGQRAWDCVPLGPKSWGLPLRGTPSLYCISVFVPPSYEGDLLRSILIANAGMFLCDGFDVFASEPSYLGNTVDGIPVNAIQIPKISVGVSQDGTAGNAQLFMAVWDKIVAHGRFFNYDWTIKVDPDAVLVPSRLRDHMRPHLGKNVYVVNCNKYPDSPNFPMMFGAVEIFSQSALVTYSQNSVKCGKELPWQSWGEDFFMTHCMDYIGVGRIGDFGVLGDNMCTGANCFDTYTSSFHPFKSTAAWFTCWKQATR